MTLENEVSLLHEIEALNENVIRTVINFVGDLKLRGLTQEYEVCLGKRNVDIGFNLFVIISDIYYRENFHSDILSVLIDPRGKHQEQENYLRLFLEFIRSQGGAIHLPDYASAQVVREEGKVDLLIKDDNSRRAIIIENKINNAGDISKQIPRYLERLRARGYNCDDILFDLRDGQGMPSRAASRRGRNPMLGLLAFYTFCS